MAGGSAYRDYYYKDLQDVDNETFEKTGRRMERELASGMQTSVSNPPFD